MANIKISELDELVNVADNDYLPIVDTSENETKKVAIQRIGAGGKSGDTLPIGSIVPYGNETAPANWLICDGSAISRTTYADLFAVIGTKFGSGDGSTTFNLPNMKGKVAVGLDSNDNDFNTIGKTGGEKAHTLTLQEMPTHNHMGKTYSKNFNAGETIPKSRAYARSYIDDDTTGGVWKYSGSEGVSGAEITDMIETSNSGGNQPHNNLQPYQVQNYIIKAFQSAGVIGNVVKVKTNSDTDTYSCNYINNIIETGTNDKGRYEKYANGMLKCYYTQTISTDIKNSWGSLFISPVIQLQDYPMAFKAITSLNMSIVGISASAWIINGGDFNLYRPCPINLCVANPLNLPNDFRISVCAIGTWK